MNFGLALCDDVEPVGLRSLPGDGLAAHERRDAEMQCKSVFVFVSQRAKEFDVVERFDSSINFLFAFAFATLFPLLSYENGVRWD